MKQSIQISALIIFAFLVVAPPAAFSEVKISLKNGRDIIADSCREVKDKLICEKMGGTFEFDKKDVLDVKSMTITHEKMDEIPVLEPIPAGEGQKKEDKSTDATKDPAKPEEGVLVRGTNPAQEKRLDEITKRKLELKQERETLSKEREQLQQDVKNMGMIYKQEQLDVIKKRISTVEMSINRFNEEVKKLNAEETGIIEGLKEGLKKAEEGM